MFISRLGIRKLSIGITLLPAIVADRMSME